jgi:hypothetical protein
MNFDLNEEQALLKAMVERFGAEHHGGDLEKRRRQRAQPGGFDRANWAALAELGLTALPFAEADCGLGGGAIEIVAAAEPLGQALATEPFTECLVPAAALLGAATGAARGPAVAAVVGGTALPAMAVLETAGRYNLAHVETRAKEVGGAWQLSGAKTAVWQGMAADLLVVSARVAGGPRDADGIALFLVEAVATGVARRGWRAADGQLAAEIALHDAPARRLEGVGLAALEKAVAASWLAAAAEMVGTAQLLFDTTLAYVKTRVQFGKPLGSFQVIQHRLADAYVLLEQSRSLLLRAALAPESQRSRMAAGAKAFVADAARRIAHEAVQLHGGMGVTDELLVGHGLKRIQLLSRLFGDPEQAAGLYARAA